MMKILISPAKSLNLTSEIPLNEFTNPIFPKETSEIISKLKKMSVSSLGSLLGVSKKLALASCKKLCYIDRGGSPHQLTGLDTLP